MKRLSLLLTLLATPLMAHLKIYRLTPSTSSAFSSSSVDTLGGGVFLLTAYDSSSATQAVLKVDPYAGWITSCRFPTSATYGRTDIKLRGEYLLLGSSGGPIISDTNVYMSRRIFTGWFSDADLLNGDTLIIAWGDTLKITLGIVSASGFTPLNSLKLDVSPAKNIRYSLLILDRAVVVAHPSTSADTLMLSYFSTSAGNLQYDSTFTIALPSGWSLTDSSFLKLRKLPTGDLVLGFTMYNGTENHPALFVKNGTAITFIMDSSGILTDMKTTPSGVLVVSDPYAQLVPYPLSDSSLHGFVYPSNFTDGAAFFTFGHYIFSSISSTRDALDIVYTNFNLPPSSPLFYDVRAWRAALTPIATTVLTATPTSVTISDVAAVCSASGFVLSTPFYDDISPPYLLSYTTDSLISSRDTLSFVFSEDMDPNTFVYGTEVSSYGGTVSKEGACSGSVCYLFLNVTGTDSITVHLTRYLTDTAGMPLAPASRISRTYRVMPERPRVIASSPDSGATDVPLNTDISLWFSSAIDPSTLNPSTVTLTDGSFNYHFTVTCSPFGVCVLDPIEDFPPSTNVTLSLSSGVKDTFGQPLYPKIITFTTVDVDTTFPRVSLTVPDSGDIGVPRNFSMSVLFSKPMDTSTVSNGVVISGELSGEHTFTVDCPTLYNCILHPLSAFLSSEDVSVHFNTSVKDTSGRELVPKTVTFQIGTTYDYFPPNVSILPSDTIVLYHPITQPVKAAVWDNTGILMTSWVVGGKVHHTPLSCFGQPYKSSDTTCLNLSGTPTGVYTISVVAYDLAYTQSVDSATLIVYDTVRPRVLLTYPENGSVSVPPDVEVEIIFSEDMDTSYLPYSSLLVTSGSDTFSYAHAWSNPRTLLLSFDRLLPWDSNVTVQIDSLRDLSGNPLVPYTFSFKVMERTYLNVDLVGVDPDSISDLERKTVNVSAVLSSDQPIIRAILLINGDSLNMYAKDGAYDEAVETVYVRMDTDTLSVGEYTLRVKAYNRYISALSQDRKLVILGIPLLSSDSVYVYPSPVKDHGKIRVVVGGKTDLTVEVFDLKYRRILYDKRSFQRASVYERDLPDLPSGIYLLRVRAKDVVVEKWFAVVGRR